MKFLDGYGIDTDDIILINIIYHKPRKSTEWIDYLDVIYKEISTGERRCLVIKEPEMEIYIVDEQYRDYTYNKDFIELEKCFIKRVKCKNLEMEIAKEAGDNYVRMIKECRQTRNTAAIKNVHKWRYVFGSDIDPETYFRIQYALEYESDDKPKHVTKQYADIEVDGIDIVGFPRDGSCPINAITLVDQESMQCFTFLLRNDKNPQIEEFEKNIDSFVKSLHDDFDESYGEFSYNIYMYDESNEMDLITDFFKLVNTLKRDFLMFWNQSFDIKYFLDRIQLLGYDPKDIICSNDFPVKEVYYFPDAKIFDVKKKKDYLKASCYTVYIDQMINYVKIRAGKGEMRSHKLNTIGFNELKDTKLDYSDEANIKTLPYVNYDKFVRYNIKDVLLQYGIEKKVTDVDTLYARMCKNPTQPHKSFSQTVMLKSRAYIEFYRYGYILGNNTNLEYGNLVAMLDGAKDNDDDEDEKFDGALVANPILNTETGAYVMGSRSKYIRDYVVDFDFSSLYPSIIIGFNISPSTMVGKLFISDKQVVDRYSAPEIANEKYDAAKDFMEGVLSENYLMVGTRWFNLPTSDKIFQQFEEYFGVKQVQVYHLNDAEVLAYRMIQENYFIDLMEG